MKEDCLSHALRHGRQAKGHLEQRNLTKTQSAGIAHCMESEVRECTVKSEADEPQKTDGWPRVTLPRDLFRLVDVTDAANARDSIGRHLQASGGSQLRNSYVL
jgi:hypothetical protein